MSSESSPEPLKSSQPSESPSVRLTRRHLLAGATLAVGGLSAAQFARRYYENFQSAATAVLRAEHYELDLEQIVRSGLKEIGVDRARVAGKSVMLKPNLVEPTASAPHVNTHPALIRAVAEAFRSLDASEVIIAEGQGHIRDTFLVLEQSGLEPVLREARLPFVDLNTDEVFTASNQVGFSKLSSLYLPKTLRRADLIVSLPKMKTHHWAGVTLSMKNLFGVMPGNCYGWPKNVLHHAGLERCIVDIAGTVRPHLAIVDGIVGMEGDGPIMGTPVASGVIVMGESFTAVDSTAARLMGFDPSRIRYLNAASGLLGPIQERNIEQRGETVASAMKVFSLPDHPHFRQFRA